jgi:hypothetical protein
MALRPKEQFTQLATGNLAKHISIAKTAAQSVNTQQTPQSDTDLTFSVAAGDTWLVEYLLDVGAVLSTTGLTLAVAVPSGSTVNVSAGVAPAVVTAADEYEKRSGTASATLTFAAAKLAAVTDAQVRVMAYVSVSTTAGSITLQFAQATSSGTNVTVRAGSFLKAVRMSP